MATTEPLRYTPATDPRTLLSAEELDTARANVARAPRLTPAQLDTVAAVLRPHLRALLQPDRVA
ncbi:hypothetical protein [Actinosynnema mirum]|uniref:Uncharacterized protein n=1 Tax=Actinosynnema mirum (strain ATCC 29888 / DSM 43827 / JCM 3225 / NBRC 14064 / NCIMB 13271 / NRRL B-12336 / IMRU 3971 / 101) TaxID=446462 RepID=C6W8P9_ACTMD|nr:hypothetical protein [Actinosynnema mirum]ACU37148.1 hypothetical protein Amir_3241 [Actinosynnema mirum DSM 43827]